MSEKLEFGKPIPPEMWAKAARQGKLVKHGRKSRQRRVKATPAASGTGPEDETCGTCQCYTGWRSGNKKFYKCSKAWNGNGNPDTDIRLKWAACSHWERDTKFDLLMQMVGNLPQGYKIIGHRVVQFERGKEVWRTDDEAEAIARIRSTMPAHGERAGSLRGGGR